MSQPEIDEATARGLLPTAAVHVAGEYVDRPGGVTHVHVYPGDGKVLGEWTLAGVEDVDRAVSAAGAAQRGWAAAPPARRREALLRMAAACREHRTELAAIGSLEMGMPIRASLGSVLAAADWFAYYAGWTDKIEGLVAPVPGALDYAVPEPFGVVGAIIPWNGPAVGLAVKVAPALAAGNAIVLKPAEPAPLSAGVFARLAVAAGLPAGLFSVVPGGPEIGAALCAHPDVALLSFTGGNGAGRAVGRAAADRHVPTIMELGGKSAALVFADADVERAARLAVLFGVAQNSGQGCFLPTRLLVERAVYDRVVEVLERTARGLVLGRPFAPGTQLGPVVDAEACARILGVFERARAGAEGRLLVGGRRAGGDLADGFYLEPTVYADVDPAAPLATEEIFGPVLSVLPFDDEDEAVTIANASAYGLAGYVWTENLRRAHRVAARLAAGYVSVNGLAALPAAAPFGGWKASGYGTEGGAAGLRQMLRTKNVHVAG